MQRVLEDAEPALTEAIVLASCKSPPNYKEPKRMKILVTGGTGHVGSEVVKELQKRKADVRILIRKEETPAPAGVQVMVGDLLDPVSVQKALHGVDKLYLLNAVSPDELTQGLIAYDLARKVETEAHRLSLGLSRRALQGRPAFRLEAGYRKRLARV